jgi:uncharacterized protein YecE (DUF72 family)
MKRRKGNLYIGTSGWIYSHWDSIFYPEDLLAKDRLKYFSRYFKTAEVNYSFYHLPRPSTYQNWYNQTPGDFIFSVKVSRFITHIKRLSGVKEAWKQFIENALCLKEKLGPILLQLPPSFKCNSENISRVKDFLTSIVKIKNQRAKIKMTIQNSKSEDTKPCLAIEVRHSSFKNPRFFNLLKKYKVALVISDSPTWQKIEQPQLADFVYIRMHGSKVLFASKYTKKELSSLAQKIKKWLEQGLDVYCYFNNDFHGYALENAKELLKLCE